VIRYRLHGFEVTRAGGGETRLDHVDPHALELARDADLLLPGHGRARTLLAVAERGIKYEQSVRHDWSPLE